MPLSLVSIIIPHYNRSLLIQDTINSVTGQKYQNWELIIVDDGSEVLEYNSVLEYIKQDSRIFLVKRKSENKGPSACRNDGLALAKGDYIIFLDSDDLLSQECIVNRMKRMSDNSGLDFAVFNMAKFNSKPGDTNDLLSLHPIKNDSYLSMFLRLNIPWQVMAAIWKKEALVYLSGFNEYMDYAEDPELHARALLDKALNFYVYKDDAPDSYYRLTHDVYSNSSSDLRRSINGRIRFILLMHKQIMASDGIEDTKKKEFLKCLKAAYKNVISHFFTDRPQKFREEFQLISSYCLSHRIINNFQYNFSKAVFSIWQRNPRINKYLHFKGLVTRLYLIFV